MGYLLTRNLKLSWLMMEYLSREDTVKKRINPEWDFWDKSLEVLRTQRTKVMARTPLQGKAWRDAMVAYYDRLIRELSDTKPKKFLKD